MSRIGTMIGQYRMVREIGRGGMGVVYEAEHVVLGQRAAIKMIVGLAAEDSDFIRRFEAEARAACAAQHPGLVKVFDFGRAPDGHPFLMMEYIEGETLRAALSRVEHFSVERARRIAHQIAAALAAIHAREIIHRDLKPENVMLVVDDAVEGHERIKLLDFGIARQGTSAAATQPGVLVGTPAYMAPEQCTSGRIGPATDVYAAGIVLHEMLCGAPPFTGESMSVMLRHVSDDVPTDALANVPSELRDLVLETLAKEPTRRPSAQALADRLTRQPGANLVPALAATLAVPLRSEAMTRRRRHVMLAPAVVVTLVGATFGVVRAVRVRGHEPVVLTGMVAFRGGSFAMGRTSQELAAECVRLGPECRKDALDREQPPRQVHLSPFLLDAHEVTNEEFAVWLNIDPGQLHIEADGPTRPDAHVKDPAGILLLDLYPRHLGIVLDAGTVHHFRVRPGYEHKPVVQVSWDGARQFCMAFGKRLPTEAEWEFAARRDTVRHYPWGDQEPRCDGVILGRQESLPCAALPRGPGEVASASQDWTADRIADLGGNVSEWVFDAFTRPYYPPCGECIDPTVDYATSDGEEFRVFRGGSWATTIFARASARGRWKRHAVADNIGFRCAVAAP